MAMKHCPVCGEKYSDTYKRCPFCEEEQALRGGETVRRKGGHRASQKGPSMLSPVLILVIVLLGALLVYLLFGSAFQGDGGSGSSQSGSASQPDASYTVPDISGSGSASSGQTGVPAPVDVSGLPETLTLNKQDFTMKVGDTPVKLSASGGSGSYVWSSEDESIATVDENGTVVAISAGTVNVVATDGSGKGTCIVRVKGSGTPNTGSTAANGSGGQHTLNREDFTLPRGQTFQLKVSGVTTGLTWNSSNTGVATVSGDGTVTAVGSGTATVNVSWDGMSLSCIVRVP